MYMGIRKIKQALASRKILTGAQKLLRREANGLAFDFTDKSVKIIDATTQSNNRDTKGITDGAGNKTGPGSVLTYTSPSNKLCLQADGYIKYGAHNLCLQSEDFTTTWGRLGVGYGTATADQAVSPLGTLTADLMTGEGSGFDFRQTVTVVNGATYDFSISMKQGTSTTWVQMNLYDGSSKRCWFDISTGTLGSTPDSSITATSIVDQGGGWYRLSGRIVSGGTSLIIILRFVTTDNDPGTSGAENGYTAYFHGAHLYRYPAVTDYVKTTSAAVYTLPYTYDTSGTCEGLLVEEARTNLITIVDFSNGAWAENNIGTVSAASVTGVDGTTSGFLLTANSGSAVHSHYKTATISVTSGSNYTHSLYVKAGTHDFVAIGFRNAVAENFITAVFDLGSGGTTATETDVGTSSGTIVSTSMEDVGNGWIRISLVGSFVATSGTFHFMFAEAATGNTFNTTGAVSFNAAGTETFSAMWPQTELGSFPTSPVLTYGATATRAVDDISIATSAFPWSASTGTAQGKFSLVYPANSSQQYIAVIDANGRYLYTGSANSLNAWDGTNGNQYTASLAADTMYHAAISFSGSTKTASLDGSDATSNATFDGTFGAAGTLHLGYLSGSGIAITGKISLFAFYSRALSGAELNIKTGN